MKTMALELITKQAFIEAGLLQKLNMNILAAPLMGISRVSKLNSISADLSDKQGLCFVDEVLRRLNLKFEVNEKELQKIPRKGSFITVSNYPYGGIDALFLIHLLAKIRPDFKLLNNFSIQSFEPIDNFLLAATDEDLDIEPGQSSKVLDYLDNGGALGMFPAGKVSQYHQQKRKITDQPWQHSLLKLIKEANVPVIPIYFQGRNSFIFHLMEMVHPQLGLLKLPSEMLNKKSRPITVRIGRAVKPKDQEGFTSPSQLGRFLRAKTYSLGSPMSVKKFYAPLWKQDKKLATINLPINREILASEVEGLRKKNLLLTQGDFEVFIAKASKIPNVLNEIGRLREVTFRAVGEGTGLALDLDEYDLYYHQLFIWDKENQNIAGGYRIGKGSDVIHKYGVKGMYTRSLFKFKDNFIPYLFQAIELGRSFVVKEYQQKRLPLFLLWKGIMQFLISNPEYRYLIGPVSISNNYSNISKSLMIEFIKANHYDQQLAQLVTPKKQFKVKAKKVDQADLQVLLENYKGNVHGLSKAIQDIEPEAYAFPVLLRKYIDQNAKIIGFNVDPLFQDSLDGLMILDIRDLPQETIETYKTITVDEPK